MTRQPMKPHREGYEDEEDCEGFYDPDEQERRRCHSLRSRLLNDPCRICFGAWLVKEKAIQEAEWAAKTPEEKARHMAMIRGLRELQDRQGKRATMLTKLDKAKAMVCKGVFVKTVELDPDPNTQDSLTEEYNCKDCTYYPYCLKLADTL